MLKLSIVCVFALVLFNLSFCQGRDVNKAQTNADFLNHEAGVNRPSEKHGQSKNIFDSSDFPELRPHSNVREIQKPSGKRDYVAPTWTTPKTKSSAVTTESSNQAAVNPSAPKRDYVAPTPAGQNNLGITRPSEVSTSKPTTVKNIDSNGKRDYVAPNWPTLPPVSSTHSMTTKSSMVPTTKPPSFSSIVAGSNKPSDSLTPQKLDTTSSKPMAAGSLKPAVPNTADNRGPTTRRPANPVLPSSIVNKNKNTNQNNDNGVTDEEIQRISEELLKKDTNNAAKHITVNLQEKTTSSSKDDKAPQPLFVVPENVWNMPTVQKFVPLLDNYEWDTLVNEHITPQERIEESAFMDAIMSTSVIRHLMSFFRDKGFVGPDPKQQRDFMKQLWFTLYSRGKGKIGSSGFEHIFVSELKNGEVSGLHNWVYFAKQEKLNKVNYLGYMKHVDFSGKGAVLKLHFTQQGYDKPVDTMFLGTSPELEMALYTLCFITRADKDCNIKLSGKNVNIVSHTFRYRSKNLIGSSYPQI